MKERRSLFSAFLQLGRQLQSTDLFKPFSTRLNCMTVFLPTSCEVPVLYGFSAECLQHTLVRPSPHRWVSYQSSGQLSNLSYDSCSVLSDKLNVNLVLVMSSCSTCATDHSQHSFQHLNSFLPGISVCISLEIHDRRGEHKASHGGILPTQCSD